MAPVLGGRNRRAVIDALRRLAAIDNATRRAVLRSIGDEPAHTIRRGQTPPDIEAGRTIISIADEYDCSTFAVRKAMRRERIIRPERHLPARHPELADRA